MRHQRGKKNVDIDAEIQTGNKKNKANLEKDRFRDKKGIRDEKKMERG